MSPSAKQVAPGRRGPGSGRVSSESNAPPRAPPSAPDARLSTLLEDLPPELRPIADQLRSTVRSCAPELVEAVKWGNPVWTGRSNVLCLMAYPAHLNLGFFRGAELAAGFPEVTGTGASMRHVRLSTVELAASPGDPPDDPGGGPPRRQTGPIYRRSGVRPIGRFDQMSRAPHAGQNATPLLGINWPQRPHRTRWSVDGARTTVGGGGAGAGPGLGEEREGRGAAAGVGAAERGAPGAGAR